MQLQFNSIVRQSFRARAKQIDGYVKENRLKYRKFAKKITPDLSDPSQVWDRIAFAILSANTGFEQAVKALSWARHYKGNIDPDKIVWYGMIPRKAEYLNQLPVDDKIFYYLRRDKESWDDYRLRLQTDILGLGLAKASFTACLLYPLEADIACIDTHICKVYLGLTGFKTLSLKTYREVEQKIRNIAKKFHINTFLAQWLVWDITSRTVSNSTRPDNILGSVLSYQKGESNMKHINGSDKAMIRMIMGNIHVGKSYCWVARYWLKRSEKHPKPLRFEIANYGLECHRSNRDEFSFVMGGIS